MVTRVGGLWIRKEPRPPTEIRASDGGDQIRQRNSFLLRDVVIAQEHLKSRAPTV